MRGEELYDREGVRREDQQAIHDRPEMAEGRLGAGGDASHDPGCADLLDDPAERRQEVQAPVAGQAIEDDREEITTKRKSKRPQPRRAGQIITRDKDKWLDSIFLGKDAKGKKRNSVVYPLRVDLLGGNTVHNSSLIVQR